ncbi:MAG: hypothetical protein MZV65_54490 [Chromatiales bacterium]|nr:hypothetical protein [Chromatiales bacterium]
MVQKGDTLWDISGVFLQRSVALAARSGKINPQVAEPAPDLPGRRAHARATSTASRSWPSAAARRGPAVAAGAARRAAPDVDRGPVPTTSRMKFVGRPRAAIDQSNAAALSRRDVIAASVTERCSRSGWLERPATWPSVSTTAGARRRQPSSMPAAMRRPSDHYHVVRPGNRVRHPETGELLAYEASYLGDAELKEPGILPSWS